MKSLRECAILLLVMLCVSSNLTLQPSTDNVAAAYPLNADDGGLILQDELNDLTKLHSFSDIMVKDASDPGSSYVENDTFFVSDNGPSPHMIYKVNDIKSFILVAYTDPSMPLPAVHFEVSKDQFNYTSVTPALINEGVRDGSWNRLVFEQQGLQDANYLKISWTAGASPVYISKIRLGYTGGAGFTDTGFETTLSTELFESGGWEVKYAKTDALADPDFTVSIENEGGVPGRFLKITGTAASKGAVLLGQRVTLPSFFTGPSDLVATADFQLFSALAVQTNVLKLVIMPDSEWDNLSSTAGGAGIYTAAELTSYTWYDGSLNPEQATEWEYGTTAGTDLTSALGSHTGSDVVIALYAELNSSLGIDEAYIDNFELNLGELSNTRPHFIHVKSIRDKIFGYRWAQDVVNNYKSKYDDWLTRDTELIPDSTHILENRFTDPINNVALIFEYKSYNDILAMGYDYDTYYQVAEFKSPGKDPNDPSDDLIISAADPSISPQMDSITKGYFSKWIQYHTDAAMYLSYLYVLTGEQEYADKAGAIVKEFADKYPQYVLHDVVSPIRPIASRVFYSVLSEGAYFVTPMVYAVDNLYNSGVFDISYKKAIREDMLYPSADVLKRSANTNNFQVIQDTAIGLIGYLYDDADLIAEAKEGYVPTAQAGDAMGMFNELLNYGVGEDGFWFEGTPSYHGFVLKEYIFLADAAQRFGSNVGENLYASNNKFKSMFDAMLNLPYPDLTLQANNDSPYKPNLITPIYLWMIETADREYNAVESQYRAFLNQAYTMVDRSGADLFSLLTGYRTIPYSSEPFVLHDANMSGVGTVLTRNHYNGQTYMSTMDYGIFTGSHDHYDKLNVTTYGNGRVWLDDLGIGPYGTESADFYYRMSAAHNTVVVPDRNQAGISGSFLALGRTNSMHYSAAAADGIFADVQQYRRALITVDDWMLDVFKLRTYDEVTFDWFARVPDSTMELSLAATPQTGKLGTANGYQHTELLSQGTTNGKWSADFTDATDINKVYRITMLNDQPMDVFEAQSYGTANKQNVKIPVLAARQTIDGDGQFVAIHEYSPDAVNGIVQMLNTPDGIRVTKADGEEVIIQYDISHATEEASFMLLRRDSNNDMMNMEISNDNRLMIDYKLYAHSDEILRGLSIAYDAGVINIENEVNDPTPYKMTTLTFYAGDETFTSVNVDGAAYPFTKEGDYITIVAPLKAAPTLSNQAYKVNASEDAYVKEQEPNRVLGEYSTIGVRNTGSSGGDMVSYIKFDLNNYSGNHVSESAFRFYAYDNAAPYNPVELSIYGIVDNSWDENSLTWMNAPNIASDGTGKTIITGLGSTAYYIDTISLEDANYSWHEVDVTDFVKTYGLNNKFVSFMIAADHNTNDWIFIPSKESGSRPPQLIIKESIDITAEDTTYARGGSFSASLQTGSVEMQIMDAPDAADDRISYMKFDLSEYSYAELGKGVLSFQASSASPDTSTPITVYGIKDDSWTESDLTWDNSSNHESGDTTITNIPDAAVPVATVSVIGSSKNYSVDVSGFLKGRLSAQTASFILVDENDGNVLITIDGRLGSNPPNLSMYQPVAQEITQSAYIWGGTYANSNLEYSAHLIVKNTSGTGADRKSYLKIDLESIQTNRVNRAILRLYGKNTTSSEEIPITVYGIIDNSWSSTAITFNNAPNHNPTTGDMIGVGVSAFKLDTIPVGPAALYEWDVSDFIYAAMRSGEAASLVVVMDDISSTGYMDFNSSNGIIKPSFLLSY
ncbi:DNRLRE domain-containing protein [Paenibacillus sp. GXUN7292]|uniref:DNRLRE domain-containing protein n=1 Tax=Paenibacillus sp. GXUN7292 TaxID=3422499 RepID=UPI003D7E42F5